MRGLLRNFYGSRTLCYVLAARPNYPKNRLSEMFAAEQTKASIASFGVVRVQRRARKLYAISWSRDIISEVLFLSFHGPLLNQAKMLCMGVFLLPDGAPSG
eukprot:6176460-Pleurochrysis_carterae.AAC.1